MHGVGMLHIHVCLFEKQFVGRPHGAGSSEAVIDLSKTPRLLSVVWKRKLKQLWILVFMVQLTPPENPTSHETRLIPVLDVTVELKNTCSLWYDSEYSYPVLIS